VANTLAYYSMASITAVKGFMIQARGLCYKNTTRCHDKLARFMTVKKYLTFVETLSVLHFEVHSE
jgi:hypothetical protein